MALVLLLAGSTVSAPRISAARPGSAPQASNRPDGAAIASRFIKALNAKDVAGMTALTERPFVYRAQEWETAKDGSGFELGAAADKTVAGRRALTQFLRELTTRVTVSAETPAASPPDSKTILATQLKGANPRWARLQLHLFARGFGDVEHVAIVGVDPGRLKVAGLYIN